MSDKPQPPTAAEAIAAYHRRERGWKPPEPQPPMSDKREVSDGTDRLCRALYGREAKPSDYIGGSEARMLHDAADRIVLARRDLAAERRNYEAAVKGRQDFRKAYRDMAEQVRTVLEGVDFDDLTTYIDKLKADLAAERERAEKAEANLAEMRERVRAAHDRYAADPELAQARLALRYVLPDLFLEPTEACAHRWTRNDGHTDEMCADCGIDAADAEPTEGEHTEESGDE